MEDTSNDPYGKALYKYNVLNSKDVYDEIKPTNPLRLLMHAHPDRYQKEHLPKFTDFEYCNKDIDDTDNNIKNRKREQDGLTVVEPDLEIGLMSMELGERSVFSIPKSRSKDDSMGLENIYTLIALLMRLFFKKQVVKCAVVHLRQAKELASEKMMAKGYLSFLCAIYAVEKYILV